MPDEIPTPPSALTPSRPAASRAIDWDGIRARLEPSAAQLVDELQRALASEHAPSDPFAALRAALAERTAQLAEEFERARQDRPDSSARQKPSGRSDR